MAEKNGDGSVTPIRARRPVTAATLWYPRPVVVHPGPLSAVPGASVVRAGERTSVYLSDLAAAVKAVTVSIPAPGRAWRRRSLAGHASNCSSPRVMSGTHGE